MAIDRLEIIGTSGDLTVQRHTITVADRDGETAGFIFHDVDEANEPATVDDDEDTTTTTTSSPDESSTTSTTAP